MQVTKKIALIIISAGTLMACNSNHSTNASVADASNNSPASSGLGDDYYYELTTNSSGKNVSITQVTKLYVSAKGNMRSEMEVKNSADGNKTSAPIVSIAHPDKPGESISIDDSAKTYTIDHFDSSDFNTGEKVNSTATKVGEEKVMGFNCVHARVIANKTIANVYSSTDTIDIWKSNDVPQQASVKNMMKYMESKTANSMYSTETAAQLKQMGCDGFLVKMTMHGKDFSLTMQLTKMERKDLPASMFEIPAGYKEVKDGL
jgi:hypothetical protein